MQKEAELKRRGTEAMGFDQNKATHHFRLTPSGGSIEILVSSSSDTTTRDQIRSHLKEVADEFSQGLFDKPFATHGEMPPGTAEMKSLAKEIRYVFDETPTGAVVRIETSNAAAREAIHAFLRYQIKEHATGDSPTGKR